MREEQGMDSRSYHENQLGKRALTARISPWAGWSALGVPKGQPRQEEGARRSDWARVRSGRQPQAPDTKGVGGRRWSGKTSQEGDGREMGSSTDWGLRTEAGKRQASCHLGRPTLSDGVASKEGPLTRFLFLLLLPFSKYHNSFLTLKNVWLCIAKINQKK